MMGEKLKQFVRWMRVVLPSGRILSCVVGILVLWELLFYGMHFLICWKVGFYIPFELEGRGCIIFIMAAAYGGFRACFHPYFSSDYLKWLLRTPWTAEAPLPLGPVRFVLQDVLVFAGLILLSCYYGLAEIHWPIIVVVVAYSAVLVHLIVGRERHRSLLYIVLFLFGLVILCREIPISLLLVASLIYLACFFAVRRTLAVIASGESTEFEENLLWPSVAKKKNLGWPFQMLSPLDKTTSLSLREAFIISFLGAWSIFVLDVSFWIYTLGNSYRMDQSPIVTIYGIIVLFAVLGRLVIYVNGYSGPISLWGRIWTGRWIIPGYDRVLLPILSAIVVGIVFPLILDGLNVPAYLVRSVSVFPVLLIALGAGPTLRDWRLTGEHHIQPTGFDRRQFEKI